MHRSAWLMGLGLCVALAGPVTARADTEAQRRTLAGLPALHLHLELRGDDLAKFGLDEIALRPMIESKLVAAGIRLLDVDASAHEPGVPWLFFDIQVLKSSDAKEYSWAMQAQLQQRACLDRDKSICESVATWDTRRLGSVGRRRVKTLTDDVNDLVHQFVGAWQAGNPKN